GYEIGRPVVLHAHFARPGSRGASTPTRGGIGSPRSLTSRVEMKTKTAAPRAARRVPRTARAAGTPEPSAPTAPTAPVAIDESGALAAAEAATIDITFAD